MKGTSQMSTHQGGMIMHAARRYPTLLEVILEHVQNALDNGAGNVWVTINKRSRKISVADDGDGASQAKFEQALRSVGKTIKLIDKLGRFGLGLVSALGKCAYHTFTATPKDNPRKYITWKFVAEEISSQMNPVIPFEQEPNLQFAASNNVRGGKIQSVPWRAKIEMFGYTTDRFINQLSMDQLCEQIRTRFNVVMLKNSSVVHITIREEERNKEEEHRDIVAVDYLGAKLAEFEVADGDTKTLFRLFLARKTTKGREGKVSVGERNDDFRIPWKVFVKNLPDGIRMSSEAVSALSSGIFEGEILNNRVKLHDSRRGFEENYHLLEFCVAIDEWFQGKGSEHYEGTRDTESAERYQDIGRRTLQVVKGLRDTKDGAWLNDLIDRFKYGTHGDGHIDNVNSSKDLPEKAVSAVTPTAAPRPKDPNPEERVRTPKAEAKSHSPNFSLGPKGKKRHIVRDDSVGIGIAHEALGGSELWIFDEKFGIVTFNTEHPLWARCDDRGEKTLGRFQEWLFLQACFVQSMNGQDYQDVVRLAVHELAASFVFTLCHGDFLSERSPIRKAQEARRSIAASKKKESLHFKRA